MREWQRLMHPAHSRMEEDVFDALNREGFFPETDKHFCLLSTIPDFYFADKRLAVYLDGEAVHKNREERDSELRRLLTKRHGLQVLTIPYKRRTKKRRKEIVAEIVEALK